MDRYKLSCVIDECERFLERVRALPEPRPYEHSGHQFTHDYYPREQGAIRRASMDLTRALADLRRPNS